MKEIFCFPICLIYQLTFAQMQLPPQILLTDDVPANFSGNILEKYPDGRPKLWKEMFEGKAEGLWLEWYPNGSLRYRANWSDNQGQGRWEYYYANGVLRSESTYKDDLAQGLTRSYHANGQLAEESTYLDGKLHGISMQWDAIGIPLSKKRFEKGVAIIDLPELFQTGIISTKTANEWDLTFTPDGNTCYFTRRLASEGQQKIYVTTRENDGKWNNPVVAPFSTDTDESPFISPDGEYFFFASYRPIDENDTPLPMDMNIWMMDKVDAGWSEPRPLPDQINKNITGSSKWPENYETSPAIDSEGRLYFWTKSSIADVSNIYCTVLGSDGTFGDVEELVPPSSHQWFDSAPVISRDGSLLLFSSEGGRAGGYGNGDIYYATKTGGQWTAPRNLGPDINTDANESFPRFSPDGKYFFFSSDRGNNKDAAGEKLWNIYYMESKYLLIN